MTTTKKTTGGKAQAKAAKLTLDITRYIGSEKKTLIRMLARENHLKPEIYAAAMVDTYLSEIIQNASQILGGGAQ